MKVRVKAPATVANVASGFDILGFAIEHPFDILEMQLTDTPGITIQNESLIDMPLAPEKNTAGVAGAALLNALNEKQGVLISIKEKIRSGSGIGSSAASAAGAVAGLNYLLGEPFKKSELIRFAMEGERAACGVAHADNVGPCLLGNVVLIRSYHPLDIVPIEAPELYTTIIHPHIEVRTEDARNILKKEIQLKDAITQWGNTAGLIAGLIQQDYGLISRSLNDVIIEPIRSLLIPGFKEAKAAAISAGALGCSISGSGPSMFALSENRSTASKAAEKMSAVFNSLGIDNDIYISPINRIGTEVIEL